MALASSPVQRILGWDRYDVLDLIGTGTAADVFRVRDRRTGVLRAAKVLKPKNAANPKILARFEDEFRILRTLHHPHLPEVYDYGWTAEGGRFLIMELVDGVPLDEYFRANPTDIWAILYELCETLTFVHNHKLLHQDIKPSNILVKRTTAYGPDLPLVKLIDFGLIFRRDAGSAVELVGTPEYVAPEVVRGETSLTRAVDYYSLGATLYELLVGRPPFVGFENDVLRAHVEQTPVIEEEALEWAELYPHVRALLTKDRMARLEAFEELRRAVVSRLTGGIDELDRAYGLARIESLPMLGKEEMGQWLAKVDQVLRSEAKQVSALDISGRSGAARNHIVDSVCAECVIRGALIVRFGRETSVDLLAADGKQAGQVDRFSKAMARLGELRPEAVLLVIDGIERLKDDEAGFIRYVSTRRALTTESETPFLFVIAHGRSTTSHPLDPYLPADRHVIEIPADMTPSDTRDSDDDIRAQIMASGIWARSDARRKLLAYVVSHPAPVPIEWAREFVGVTVAEFADDVDQLVARHMVQKVLVDGMDAIQASGDVRAVVQGLVSQETTARGHRDLAVRLIGTIGSSGKPRSLTHGLIAHHYRALGEDRSTLVEQIRAVKAAWREKSLSTVERLSQASLDALAKSGSPHAKAARRHFVKQWVQALWARNQHTRAKQVIDDHIVKYADEIPPSLLPKYIRGILDAKEPTAALAFMDSIVLSRLAPRVRQQLIVERALVLHQNARHDASLQLLNSLGKAHHLNAKDRNRVAIYKAMNLADQGAHQLVERMLSRAARDALKSGCTDEFVLMAALRAQGRTLQGKPHGALRIIAQALRIAHKHEHYLRLNALYRLAASAYRDVGEPRRSMLVQRKALTLAGTLGIPSLEAMSWSRLSEHSRLVGHMGDALRYIRKAEAVIGGSSYETERAQLKLFELSIHGWLMSPELEQKIKQADWIGRTRGVNERGRYFMFVGDFWAGRSDWRQALEYYGKAQTYLTQAGLSDNLIILAHARLRVALQAGLRRVAFAECNRLRARDLVLADSRQGQLERRLALLEFAYQSRSRWRVVKNLCDSCLALADQSVEARIRLDTLSVVFRVLARHGRVSEAREVFERYWKDVKSAVSNVDDRYVASLMERLNVAQLASEFQSLTERNKAGASPALLRRTVGAAS